LERCPLDWDAVRVVTNAKPWVILASHGLRGSGQMGKRVRSLQLAVVVGATLLVAIVGTAIATIPDGQGIIHACYKKANPNKGLVRLIDTDVTDKCPSGFLPIDWNQQGPQGPAGETPEPYRVTAVNNMGSRIPYAVSVRCNPGDKLQTGGYRFAPYPSGYQGSEWEAGVPALAEVMGEHPVFIPTEDVWAYEVTSRSLNGDAYTLTLFAYCIP
jgi:hypothetical protein